MTTNDETERGAAGCGGLSTLAKILLLIVIVASAFLGGLLVTTIHRSVTGLTSSEGTTRVRPRVNVVVQVRELSRLETVQFHVERVIDIEHEESWLKGAVTTRDALLLVAAADVTAGVDLGELRDDAIVTDPDSRRVRVRLPAPRVFTTTLDNDRTYVYRRDTDLLARRKDDLESRARREAESQLEKAALDAGILERARAGARRSVGALLSGMGYDDVEIAFEDE